jgi:hypothetical protein
MFPQIFPESGYPFFEFIEFNDEIEEQPHHSDKCKYEEKKPHCRLLSGKYNSAG